MYRAQHFFCAVASSHITAPSRAKAPRCRVLGLRLALASMIIVGTGLRDSAVTSPVRTFPLLPSGRRNGRPPNAIERERGISTFASFPGQNSIATRNAEPPISISRIAAVNLTEPYLHVSSASKLRISDPILVAITAHHGTPWHIGECANISCSILTSVISPAHCGLCKFTANALYR